MKEKIINMPPTIIDEVSFDIMSATEYPAPYGLFSELVNRAGDMVEIPSEAVDTWFADIHLEERSFVVVLKYHGLR